MKEHRTRRVLLPALGLLAAGAVAGGVLAGTLSAGAATSTPTPTAAVPTQPGPGAPRFGGPGHALGLSGTVRIVDAAAGTVTIKTAGGTTVYTVGTTSDIDKNGEAQLSSLAAGDAVRFSVVGGTHTIDKLHAGDEARDMPAGPPAGPAGG